MKHLITAVLFFHCYFALSSPKEILLQCEKPSDSERLISLSYNEKIFYVANAERGCDSEYVYKKSPDKAGGVITFFPGTDDLGLKAYNIVYLVSQGANHAIYAGEVPASAIELENGMYESTVQSGGSI